MACQTTVHESVCVEAVITITPVVEVGEIQTFCVDGPFIGRCTGTLQDSCSFKVSHTICVQIPLTFQANATAVPTGIACGTPASGDCSIEPTVCTFTIGFFRNHPTFTSELIADAGGSIILGSDSTGLSFTVTTANAANVLNFKTPSPPAPTSPPFAQQYQVLYAQLLAANLNVLNGATCDFAATAIEMANSFLASSPTGGMAGAPAVQDPLELFNSGDAPDCPAHCNG